ncbi:MAG: hypothetical protein H0X62_11370 [Bacteroidetes bacterium]|nr:hypothetical protein [Bacteroidota bacterium]
MKVIFTFLSLLLFFLASHAQDNPNLQVVKLHGVAIDANTGYGMPGLMVLNQRTKTGIFGSHDGSFSISIQKNDSIKFSLIGYSTQSISFKDSAYESAYQVIIKMEKLKVDLHYVEVFPSREYAEIKKDIDELGVKYEYQTQGFAGLASPVTFLYERFSKFERQKQKAAELYNEDAKKDILKELFKTYVKADINELSDLEFDDFLIYCNLPEEFIKSATQYELVVNVKQCFEVFMRLNKLQKR